jgi:hypothetical protein
MLADCCAPVYYYFNESTLAFANKASSSDGKYDRFDEEGWTLLPNNLVLTIDAYTTNTVLTGTNSETYNSTTNTWSTARQHDQATMGFELWSRRRKLRGRAGRVAPRRDCIRYRR